MMGTATASGPDRATKAAEAAVTCPLLEGIDLSGARGVLVLISAARATFKLSESRNAMNTIRRYAADEAHVIYGTAYDESLGDSLRVTVIATGLNANTRAQLTPVDVRGQATGGSPATWPQQPVQAVVQPVPVQQHAVQPQQVIPQNVPVVSHTINAQQMVQPIPVVQARTGTDNLPILNTTVVTPAQVMPAMESATVPSVWRTNRTQAAAKVESLVSNGMDELEIPAFLRKQAD
jgi:cell division protein FtsZ